MMTDAKQKLSDRLIEAYHNGYSIQRDFIVEAFPKTDKYVYSYDDVLVAVMERALYAASLGYRSMLFDFEYEQIETEESIQRQLDPPIIDQCQYYIVEEGKRQVKIKWNEKNSPHLLATLAGIASAHDMIMGFPFTANKVWNELEWASLDEARRFEEISKIAGGYEAYRQGVPIDDIVV